MPPATPPTDPRIELAGLVADLLATVESMRACGAEVLPAPVVSLSDTVAPSLVARSSAPVAPRPAAPAWVVPAPVARPPAVSSPPAASPAPLWSPPAAAPAAPVAPSPVAPAPAASPGAALFGSKWARVAEGPDALLAQLKQDIQACRACGRCGSRQGALDVEGSARPLVLVITDPPSIAADQAGTVLVGEATLMLQKMLLNVVRVDHREVQTSPVVRCAGGEVTAEEAALCRPFLERQIALARPRAILVLGEVARSLLGLPSQGTWGSISGVPALATAHPDWLLAHPGEKRQTLGHLQELARRVG